MQVQGQTAALVPRSAFAHDGHHTTIIGFVSPAKPVPTTTDLARGRSLLSELLKDAAVAPSDGTISCVSDEFESDDMDEACLGSMEAAAMDFDMGWSPVTSSRTHITDNSDRSSTCSQPIPIPACTYFKDEVQRAALEKLNQKRKWYQQQLENERLMSKGSIPKPRPAQASISSRIYHRNYARQPN